MRALLAVFVAVVLVASLVLSPAVGQAASSDHLLLTEVLYDPAGPEPGAEFIELFNPMDRAASISGWSLADNSASDPLPAVTIQPGQHLVIAANQSDFLAAFPGFAGHMVSLESPIGNGLSNSGDRVSLLDAAGVVVDAMSYGSDTSIFAPACPDVPEGQSLARSSTSVDTDAAADWFAGLPSPGGPWMPLPDPTSTTTPSASPSPVATPTTTPSRTPSPTRTATPTATATSDEPTVPSPTPSTTPTPSATPTQDAAATQTFTPTPTHVLWPPLLMSEVLYDPPQSGTDNSYEFVEIYNPTDQNVRVMNWRLADNGSEDLLPTAEIAPHSYLVVAAARDGFLTNFPDFSGNLVTLEGSIGNGLSNSGDRVILLAPDGTEIDRMSYGSDIAGFDPSCPDVDSGESLARVPSHLDTDSARDWYSQPIANPGASGVIPNTPTPTPSRTATLTRTVTPTRTPSPTKTPSPTRMATTTRTTSPTVTPTRTSSPTKTPTITRTPLVTPTRTSTSTAVVIATATPTASHTPTRTRIPTRTPSATPSATSTFPASWPRMLLSEVLYDPIQEGSDADWEFVEILNPTDAEVTLAGWQIGDNSSTDALPAFTLPPHSYAVIAAKEEAFRSTYPAFTGRLIVLGSSIGNGLSNTGDVVRLIAPDGSQIDGMSYGAESAVFDPPCPKARPGESLARWSAVDTDSAADWMTVPAPNPGESVRATPTPTVTYTVTSDPAVTPTNTTSPMASATPTPTATRTGAPTAAATYTRTPTSTPTMLPPEALRVVLNEILPDPERVDWDRDGSTGFIDEWIELYNPTTRAIALEGWTINHNGGSYRVPTGVVIWPQSFLLLYRTQTHLGLSDWRDKITLSRSDGTIGDVFAYDYAPGEDRSYCRSTDGAGFWTRECEVTPGQPNRLLPSPPPAQTTPTHTAHAGAIGTEATARTIANARRAPEDTRVVVIGTITLPPGLVERTVYLQDATGGIKIYLRKGEYAGMKTGDLLQVTGWTRSFYGETEISVPDPSYLISLGSGSAPGPMRVTSAGLSEANEGRLLQVTGAVTRYETHALVLKDAGGQIRIYFPASLPWRRPYVQIGEIWAVQGVLGHSTGGSSPNSGYYLIPRFKNDVIRPPLTLPITGATAAP